MKSLDRLKSHINELARLAERFVHKGVLDSLKRDIDEALAEVESTFEWPACTPNVEVRDFRCQLIGVIEGYRIDPCGSPRLHRMAWMSDFPVVGDAAPELDVAQLVLEVREVRSAVGHWLALVLDPDSSPAALELLRTNPRFTEVERRPVLIAGGPRWAPE